MLRSLWQRIRKRRQLDRDLQDELAYHLEMRKSQARAPFGNTTLIKEEIREMWSFTHLENLWRDVRHAVRVLLRSRGHTAANHQRPRMRRTRTTPAENSRRIPTL